MKFRKIALPLMFVGLLLSAAPQTSLAQWSVGASYEIRQEVPKHGFGFRIERAVLEKAPLINLGVRAHFSYFNEENYVGKNDVEFGEVTNYDYGLAAVGGVSVGPISPYVGLGLGASTFDATIEDAGNAQIDDQNPDDNVVYYNGFVGAKVSIIPALKPFVEYRLEDTADYKDELKNIRDSNGRLIFGVSLSF